MLSSFFSKSKPINYILVALYMLILLGLAHYKNGFVAEISTVILFLTSILLYILPMLILHFTGQRNDLTNKGTHTILLYAFLTGILANSLISLPILISNAFLLLALWNVLLLRNEKNIKAKIFNTSMYIGIASLANFWSIGFLILVFFAIFYFEPKNYRNWIIPFVGLLVVCLFANCFTLLMYDSFFSFYEYIDPISFSFDGYLEKNQLFSVGILSICILFFTAIFIIKFNRKPANIKPILRLIIVYLILAIGIVLISPQKNTSELFFIAAPLAIIGTTYLEMEYHQFAKEINIWVLLLLPFTTLLF
ncbi:DUF6427 family protein [Aquimarina mytili]|uniref:Beta-carotene 15,15'-monooxygenase n=1 Tax=Aquimarina mytili TaxID=874423 RepID=A0A937D6P8_9FLAO|nr:DUF6427 family protein [Aquimarina mytili]MBL0684654.1 hypothetical protein [Aquimarina mytili]